MVASRTHLPESPQLRNCRRFSQGISHIAILLGGLVLAGWAFGIPALTGVFQGLATMKPNTALCFLLAGVSMRLLRPSPGQARTPRTQQVLIGQMIAAAVTAIALLTLAEFLSGVNWGIDSFIFRQAVAVAGGTYPGRMSEATAVGFLLLGGSLFLLPSRGRAGYLSQTLALLAALNGLIALTGYVYGASALYKMSPYASMALHTAALFLGLGLGVLAAKPQFGVMAAVTSDRMGGLMARRLVPVVSTLPIVMGWLRWQGELAGLYNTAFGLAIFTLANVLMLNVLLWMSASWLNRLDEQRRSAVERDLQLAAIVDSSHDAIASKDLNGTILSWNKGAEKLYGYTPAEAIGQPMTMLVPVEQQEEEKEILHDISAERLVRKDEAIRLRKDGSRVQVAMLISPVKDVDGRIVGASNISHDITSQKQAQAAVKESEERLRLFIEHAPAALAMFDREMRYLQASRRWRSDYGLGERDLIGVSHYEVFPDVPQPWKQAHHRGLAGEVLRADSDRFERADGSVQWIRWEIRPWHERNGKVGGILIFAEEITERHRAQEQLAAQTEELARQAAELLRSRGAVAEQARTLQSVLDNINDGLVAADTQGRFLLWNPAAERILGKPRPDIPPEEWSQYFGLHLPDKMTPFPAEDLPLARAMRGQAAGAEMFIRHGDAGYGAWIEATASPMRDAEGKVCGGVVAFRDITRRVLADNEIRRLNAGLEQRVRERTAQLEAVNQELEAFTYSVSHDLRAPLRQILGFAHILTEDHGPSLAPDAQRYLENICTGAQNLTQLINGMLNLSRLERQSLQRCQVGLAALVQEIVALLQAETEGRQVEWRIAPLGSLDCDPVLAKQIFQNLISNALKYSRKRERAVIEIGQMERGGCPVIFVRDNGAGFDMKYADKLFGMFQRLHKGEDFEGIGIGLATVLRIVRKHGGMVWAEAEPDRGATFYFTLSSATSQEEKALAAAK